MSNDLKVFANYLPQYHSIPENDDWWGEGFTDWTTAKKAKPLFDGHNQPRVPLNDNYYSLDKIDSIRWQAELARRYGIDGFAIYHYWFSSEKMLLQKPAELILANSDIDIEFCFLWDNCSWIRTWSGLKNGTAWAPTAESNTKSCKDTGVLAELKYGTKEDWKKHFDYLIAFFSDKRYAKHNGKPIFGLMCPQNDFSTIMQMKKYWDELAVENGFKGMELMLLRTPSNYELFKIKEYRETPKFDYNPFFSLGKLDFLHYKVKSKIAKKYDIIANFDYDYIWKKILRTSRNCDKYNDVLSGFVRYDDTPRRGKKACVVLNDTPEKFQTYFTKLLGIAIEKKIPFVFLTAWNEWGEGAYLEPDETTGYAYLEATRNAINTMKSINIIGENTRIR